MKDSNYFTCDYCGKSGTGITKVNGFKFCPMCYAEYESKSDIVNQLRKENEELKGKRFEKQSNPEKNGITINGVEFSNEQLIVLEKYREFNTDYLTKYNELKQNQTKLAVEKLEELLKYIINSKWTKTVNVKHSPMQIIVNKINEIINELKGENI